jgi:hypothetical protein
MSIERPTTKSRKAARPHLVLLSPGVRLPPPVAPPRHEPTTSVDVRLAHGTCELVPPDAALVVIWNLVGAVGGVEEALFYSAGCDGAQLWSVQGFGLRLRHPERTAAELTAGRRLASGCVGEWPRPAGSTSYVAYALLAQLMERRDGTLRVRAVAREGLVGFQDVAELRRLHDTPRRALGAAGGRGADRAAGSIPAPGNTP